MKKIDDLSFEELKDAVLKIGEPKFKANQIFDWIHNKTVESFDDMTNLSQKTKAALKNEYEFTKAIIELKLESKLDETKKYVIKLDDSNIIESVYLKYKFGNTACISSQVGCKMGCHFCASTKKGFIRNLTAAEMLKQIYLIQNDINEKISNVVIMGSGEPLENFDNIVRFLNIINDERGQNISMRKITLSTSGIVPNIYKLADENIPITLAISLHASTQEKREQIMPIARKYKLPEILKACDYYVKTTGRRLTFEYIMIKGFNDSREDAENLSRLLKNKLANVNLIPCNYVKEANIEPSEDLDIMKFKKILTDNGINATVRRELGSDINAACGQLRNDLLKM
ncbi:MAG TPA: 23S rRNA (adenine(2503)-C(2))-methyltransferase RlmN [Sedimentibacter sp.]|jgi:23S rRNA (adenine2503-C2)-methyltransferase|nr:23S rRNA (adenine(2503)-C(2))-methyltransferase RlmN [Sedimentibacter sp.]HPV85022.1 23S rRNA (adenine(2503)-C(2))-methyltransferase RlmN [Sedimentibacter sp.]HPY55497.1 23S rRNA (adenine(2503)-C(2))-methyltransferase RlmN [Sedimentibacter sp.]HQC70142.1 23S rRNA (adenine(2503)-C(2))-methyltransferase RlmN [Sedimentibacter sp.]